MEEVTSIDRPKAKEFDDKWMFEKTNIVITEYPKKELIVADIIHHTDKKTILTIFDKDTEELVYDDRSEFIEWTSEGCASSLCSKTITYIDATHEGSILIYVDMESDIALDIIKYPKDYKDYDIHLDRVDGGTLMIDYNPADYIPLEDCSKGGEIVKLIVIPEDGYTFNHGDIGIYGITSGTSINSYTEYRHEKTSTYEFIMPYENISIHVEFIKKEEKQ